MSPRTKSVQVGLNFGFFSIGGTWEPNDAERRAAWELYVELVTRVSVVPLPTDQGLLREALTSLHSLFASTRQVLRQHGPAVAEPKPDGQYSFGYLSVAILNLELRPLLATWHPALEAWEATRPEGCSRSEHEQRWPDAPQLRAELDRTRTVLADYAAILAAANDIPDLSQAIASTAPRSGSRPT